MYSTCLFCKSSLGQNESIEHFPIGRRLAFDSAKGRLWVICQRCMRWNLTPLEERWEAVEECERLFRGQALRAQTENIGLAKLKEGTELVRIGPAHRPEFAAWRYGRVFGKRLMRRMMLLGGGTAVAGVGAVVAGGPLVAAIVSFPPILIVATHAILLPLLASHGRLSSTRVVGQNGKVLRVTRADLEHTQLIGAAGDDPWRLMLRHSYGRQELGGEAARRALGTILARVNRGGAAARAVTDATGIVADAGAPEKVANLVEIEATRRSGDFAKRWKAYERGDWLKHPFKPAMEPINWREAVKLGQLNSMNSNQMPSNPGAIPRLPPAYRLALEMALHEQTEQRALEGELQVLEAAWREAEEVAAIADNLLTPASTIEFIDRQRT